MVTKIRCWGDEILTPVTKLEDLTVYSLQSVVNDFPGIWKTDEHAPLEEFAH